MQMKAAELAADEFHCATHGMIRSMVDPMQVNSKQKQPVSHLHHQQTLQYLRLIKQNKPNRLKLQQMVRMPDFLFD